MFRASKALHRQATKTANPFGKFLLHNSFSLPSKPKSLFYHRLIRDHVKAVNAVHLKSIVEA